MVGVMIISAVAIALNVLITTAAYQKGYRQGMVDESAHWCDALEKVTPPNWQSLPDPDGADKQRSENFRKIYVDTFKTALQAIRAEIVVNRVEALKQVLISGK